LHPPEKVRLLFSLLALIVFLSSCTPKVTDGPGDQKPDSQSPLPREGPPVSIDEVSIHKEEKPESRRSDADNRRPSIQVFAPEWISRYSENVVVRGRVQDVTGLQEAGSTATIVSLRWEILDTGHQAEIHFDPEGFFEFAIPTPGLPPVFYLRIVAVNTQGLTTDKLVALIAESRAPSRTETAKERTEDLVLTEVRAEAPVLTLNLPKQDDYFTRELTISGKVYDPEDRIESLSWEVEGSALYGELEDDESGTFSTIIDTSMVRRDARLIVRAVGGIDRVVERSVRLRADTSAPELDIAEPQEGEVYEELVTVRGRVRDNQPSTLIWEVIGATGLSGTAELSVEGSFRFDLDVKGLEGTQILELRAKDTAGNTAVSAITLRPKLPRKAAATAETAEAAAVAPPSRDTAPEPSAPELTIDSPEDRTYYRSSVPVAGRIVNGSILSWEIAGSGLGDNVNIGKEGTFTFQIPSADLHGTQVLRLAGRGPGGSAEERAIVLLDGNLNPSVSITSPQVDQLYGSNVRVSGAVVDPYADSPTMGGIESVAYDVSSPEVFSLVRSIPQSRVELMQDNSFDFVVTTRELSGPQDVNIVVRARSGNQTKTSVRILEGEADIPVFSAEAGDQRAVLRWDTVPSATRYSLSYRTANPGQRPGRETRIDGVSSPYVLTGLANGNRYVFQINAALPGEPDSESAEKWAIPLSADTLRPATAGEFEQIRISWPSIPGSEQYELWRSTSRDGEYASIAGALAGTNYLDRAVQYGRSYFYRVTPASLPEAASNPVLGESTAFPVKKLETAGLCRLNQARGLTLYGGYAFVAGGSEGIKIVDISSPDNPTLVGGFRTAEARDIAVRGEYAFVADGERGLKVLDVSDPRVPAEIGMRKTMDARAIALEGDIAFIADGASGLKVIDVSSPVQPTRIGSYATENACDLIVHESKLYVADGRGGLRIFDITDSAELVEVGHLTGMDVRSVAVEGFLLYLAAGAGGLIIMDNSDPGEPVELGRYAATEILDVSVSGTFAYLVDSREGMIVVDVSDPARPWRFAALPAENTSSVLVREHYAYLATASGLQVVHILIQGRSVPIAACATGGKAYDLSVSGPRAYITCHDRGVRIVDISDPVRLDDRSVIGAWSEDFAAGIEVTDSVAFVATGRRGLSILDLSPAWDGDPLTQPERIGSYYTGGTAHRAVVHSDLLFVADGQEGLKILDVTVKNDPVESGSVSSDDARDVAVMSGYALVADGENGLIVCDISDPGDPTPIATLDRQGVHRIVVQDNLVATAGRTGVDLYDFSDPRHPEVLGRFESRYVESIFIDGNYLYIAEGYRGLKVLDIQSFDRPVPVSACAQIYAVDVAVYDGYALVTDSRQIYVVEVLIPEWLRQSSSRR
jgi:hypothetical protein